MTRQPARPDLVDVAAEPTDPAAPSVGQAPTFPESPDLLVIGGGPGGLTAAAAAAETGVRVVLLDERPTLGGQYFKQPASRGWGAGPRADDQFAKGRRLIERVLTAGVTVLSGAQVWGAFARDDIAAISPFGRHRFSPRTLVLAPGAYERGIPMPGWTLPGVMTTGAAQTLWRSYGTPPGKRIIVSGNGPLNMQVAAELCRAGTTVVALAELATPAAAGRVTALARMAGADPWLIRDGVGYRSTLARGGVPVRYGSMVVSVEGVDRVQAAVVAAVDGTGRPRPGTERRYEVDAVCVGFGFQPSTELARALGARHVHRHGQLQTVVDGRGRTSLPNVWVVGDGAWIGGARLAQSIGELAGLDAAQARGATITRPQRRRARAAEANAARQRHFQAGLAAAFAAPRAAVQFAGDETLICRCEDVSRGALERALADGSGHVGPVKRATRAGMGPCQGRYCAPLIAAMAARHSGAELGELSGFAPNPPVKPVMIDDLLGPSGEDESVTAAIRDARIRLAGGEAAGRV